MLPLRIRSTNLTQTLNSTFPSLKYPARTHRTLIPASKMPSYTITSTLPVPSGTKALPVLGFGVYQTPATEAESAVSQALKAGYRHIDSAVLYRNEGPCGLAIKASGIPRDQIYFTSKLMDRKMTYESAKKQIEQTLRDSGLEYIDLILIHSPYGGPEGRKGAWKALVEATETGRVKSIGVSNYGVHHLNELEAYIKELEAERGAGKGGVLDVGQWEIHPWLPRQDIVDWCNERGVVVEAYSPLVRGGKATDATLNKIAKKHGKTWAQVLVRWSIQKGYVPLPKSVTPKRIIENADVYDFELDESDMAELHMPDSYDVCAWDPTVEPLEK